MRNAPQSIQVLGKTYAVEFVDKVDDKDSFGEHEMSTQKIKIKNEQHHESSRETLLHEVIHAVEEQLDLGMKEKQVHGLAVGLFQVLRENAALLAFITEKKRRK